ncbi:MAG: hypothetical protein K6T83_13460 [Alicyclobacillus sp.]|nr:hypothetical protein [Alicyclobacillus sp.]
MSCERIAVQYKVPLLSGTLYRTRVVLDMPEGYTLHKKKGMIPLGIEVPSAMPSLTIIVGKEHQQSTDQT